MKRKKITKAKAGGPVARHRRAARKSGKRQKPFPHEHHLMAGAGRYDPDNDGDFDSPNAIEGQGPAAGV